MEFRGESAVALTGSRRRIYEYSIANSSRDEIYEKNSRIICTDYTTNTETAKELNVTPVLYRIQKTVVATACLVLDC